MHARQVRAGLLPALLAALIAGGTAAHGQSPPAGRPPARPRLPPDPFAGLTFRNIGPAVMGGRIDDVAVLESNPAVFYVGSATGGLWRTTNNGTTWDVLFDDLDDVVSIGDIAIPPNDANTIWVGIGREQQPPERLVGQRRLQVHRRRPHMEADGTGGKQAHRARHRRSRSTTTSSTWRRSAASGAPARSAACSRPRTAGSPGATSCS